MTLVDQVAIRPYRGVDGGKLLAKELFIEINHPLHVTIIFLPNQLALYRAESPLLVVSSSATHSAGGLSTLDTSAEGTVGANSIYRVRE